MGFRSLEQLQRERLDSFAGVHAPPGRLCRNRKEAINIVMPVKTGIQDIMKILDSSVSSTGQAQSRSSLALKDKKVIKTQFPAWDKKGRLPCFLDTGPPPISHGYDDTVLHRQG